ncbi:MAG: ABC transporter ATP-binding protein [Paracoccaceae bacterium]|nr:ABC transporter ATP-binding protein [Paracoccaceae bacterium]MDE2915071.1 ABC transporter ATP-binding protein [Paracoccaceae bacterium]
MTPLVSIDGLRVEFPAVGGTVVAVRHVDLEIRPGEVLCIVGESGSGKSVTSLALMQLTRFSGGQVAGGNLTFVCRDGEGLDLRAVDESRMRQIRGNEIGMVFQEPMAALNPAYTIGWQLAEGLMTHRGLSKREARERSLELLNRVRIPDPERRLKQYPHELSGGMCQRVVIAMALACEPRLLIADEPTTALDVTVQAEILALIDRLRRETGAAVLLITHDMAVVAQMADRVAVMHGGELVETGSVRQIILQPRHAYTRALLAAVPKIGEMARRSAPARMKIPGAEDRDGIDTPLHAGEQRILEVENLTKRFPVRGGLFGRTIANVHAVEDVTFHVQETETLAMVGESGSGKSTVGRCLLRLDDPDAGEIRFRGQDLVPLSRPAMRDRFRDLQMIFQDPYGSLNPQMCVLDQIAEPIRNYGLERGSALEDRVADLLDRVRMPRQFLRRYPSELSGGQRQRVAIARALAVNPGFIVADEAVSSLDVSIQAQVLNLMMDLQADLGLSYLFISHDMAVVERVAHRVAVMFRGRIVEIGRRSDIFEDPRHSYTRTLLAAVPTMDPADRISHRETDARVLHTPIHPSGYDPGPSRYEEVSPGHFLLQDSVQ